MKNGIILAGGRATRLGPLAAQISKALVSVGNRPQVVNQVELLRAAGVHDIVVVTSPDTDRQVAGVLQRCGLYDVTTVVQRTPSGPADAVRVGFTGLRALEFPTYVIMADTYLNEPLPDHEFVGVAPAGNDRAWCFHNGLVFVDEIPRHPTDVTIGVYRFDNSRRALHLAGVHSNEDGMAQFLDAYGCLTFERFSTWQDVGDVLALGKARRDKFISRAHHKLELHDDGTITKSGASELEVRFMRDTMNVIDTVSYRSRIALFPHVYDIGEDWYTMDYVDLPSLAELWLYWPGRGDTWKGIIESIVKRVSRDLWTEHQSLPPEDTYRFYGLKAQTRIAQWDRTKLTAELMNDIATACAIIGSDTWVNGHGDLNFTNILYSLNTNAIRLVDPRGGLVPMSYEIAKLAYSPSFSAVTHNLFHIDESPRRHPVSYAEHPAFLDVWEYLADEMGSASRLHAAVALTLLAACPLHPQHQAEAFFHLGLFHLEVALHGQAR